MLAAGLSRQSSRPIDIYLLDRNKAFGTGVAYATEIDGHLLNVPAASMSAHAEEPAHFLGWLKGKGRQVEDGAFLPRGLYGTYLQEILGRSADVSTVSADVQRLGLDDGGITLALSDGRSLGVDQAVLCMGNFPPVSPVDEHIDEHCVDHYVADPWHSGRLSEVEPDDTVVLIGTSLTMVDVVLELVARGHRGRLVAVSRRGLLPAAHRRAQPARSPFTLEHLPNDMANLVHVLRAAADEEQSRGGDWRTIVDSLRPHMQALWKRLPMAERHRFMRHVRPYWDVHRHRLAPQVAEQLADLQRAGRLEIVAGRVHEITARGDGVRVRIARRRSAAREVVDGGWVVNCSGPALDYSRIDDPLLVSLFAGGFVRPGPLSLGLDVDDDYRVIDRTGSASARLFAIGPVIRGVLWETTAVPDIRRQCAALAKTLAAT
jgi:uncharacterized NAD(P)/FAD-binding protein YdhS